IEPERLFGIGDRSLIFGEARECQTATAEGVRICRFVADGHVEVLTGEIGRIAREMRPAPPAKHARARGLGLECERVVFDRSGVLFEMVFYHAAQFVKLW